MTALAAGRAGAPAASGPRSPRGEGVLVQVVVAVVVLVGVVGTVLVAPDRYGLLLAAGSVGLVAVVLGLASPALATAYLLVAAFVRLAVPSGLFPVDPFLLAFGGLLLAVAVRAATRPGTSVRVGRLGVAVGLYLGWNLFSLLADHRLEALEPQTGLASDVWRFVLIGTVMPWVLLLLAVAVLGRPEAVRVLVGTVLGIAAFSALVSIMQFHGLAAYVRPTYVVANEQWPERATGLVAQPVVHGLLLTIGYLLAVMVASDPRLARWQRVAAGVLAAACAYSVYLTLTRSAWLGLAVTVLLGAVLARGWRTGFAVTGALGLVGVAANWAAFSSGDRASGGIASSNEIADRLNINATGVWATAQEPLTGWGIGRFPLVNTYYHRSFSDVPWERGYAIVAHNDLLGISSELGLPGAVLWLTLVGLVLVRLARAVRRVPPEPGTRIVTVALLVLVAWIITGVTVDQRLFDVSNLVVTALVGSALGLAARWDTGRPRTPVAP